jgi:hypothetical protein
MTSVELPTTKIMETIKNNTWRAQLREQDSIDAMDGDDMWYEATIIACDKKSLTVRFMGWSSKWNAVFLRKSPRIAPRNSKVPNWRKTLKCGKGVEVSGDSSTWCSAVVCAFSEDRNIIQVFRAPSCTKEWYNLNSPLLAEPYTHCGYKVEADSVERRKMLNARRLLFKNELKTVEKENKAQLQKKVGEDLSSFINNEELSDIKFKFIIANDGKNISSNDPSSSILYGHKMILVARSPYFRSMLLGGMMESKCNAITIHDVSYDIFLEVLHCIYTGKANNLTHNNVFELLQAAELYCLTDLKDQVTQYLKTSIDEENVMDILIVADTFGLSKLGEECIRYAIVNYSRFNKKKLINQLKGSSNNIISDILQANKPDENGVCEQKVSNTETFILTLAEKFKMSINSQTHKAKQINVVKNQRNRGDSH